MKSLIAQFEKDCPQHKDKIIKSLKVYYDGNALDYSFTYQGYFGTTHEHVPLKSEPEFITNIGIAKDFVSKDGKFKSEMYAMKISCDIYCSNPRVDIIYKLKGDT